MHTKVPSHLGLGLRLALPVALGYFPIGLAYGVVATQHGLLPLETIAMSALVFAGSAQIIAAGLWGAGAGAAAIVASTFLVNLRHLLMSAALVPRLQPAPRRSWPLLAFGITDEFFAVASGLSPLPWPVYAYLVVFHYLGWVGSSAAGAYAGRLLGATLGPSLEFALVAMFIGLLLPQLGTRSRWTAAAVAGLCSLALGQVWGGNTQVLIAALLGATAGAVTRS